MEFCAIVFLLHVFGGAEEKIFISWDVMIHFFCFLLTVTCYEKIFSVPRYFMDRIPSFRGATSVSVMKCSFFKRLRYWEVRNVFCFSFIYARSLVFISSFLTSFFLHCHIFKEHYVFSRSLILPQKQCFSKADTFRGFHFQAASL